ncbi:RagB/SusD family nutrient uptake outer membrane protein [Reichenbachiella ulvae]|uniref:RagB/SusD family nutrient uptake outer membrane protein n=1 Tax=Reichenbachiella ulvae TaxID=2980104 RepID=A0ABT3CZK5_9BACT|nr:RagB/SusD family nutrient uptake outer membrane protein [Reichenbachiella ulvae]MCV9389120.1 RagB/SusD family nutrient uptake outer membrane protein [Reichenbachiella ulvae]
MQKNIKIFILTVLSAIIGMGCSDEFLKGTQKGTLSDESLQNETGVDLLLTAAYSILDGSVDGQNRERSGDNWWIDVLTDEAHKGSTNGDQAILHDLQTYSNWSTSNNYFFLKWEGLYAGVNRCNAVINLANSITDVDLTQKIAEARFLRGHFNFELTRIWRNVPYIDEIATIENPDVANNGPLWDEIEADFQFAITNLPEDLGPGRANSWAAKAYMGKVHLYQEEWTNAETILDDVINNGPYDLNAEFVDNFNGAGKNGIEVVFSIQHEANDGATNNGNGNKGGELNFPGGGPYGSCCGFYQPTQDLANAFKTTGGLPQPNTYNNSDIDNDYGVASADPFTPYAGELDPRIDYTVGRRGIDYNGWGEHVGFDWVRAQADAGPYLPKKNTYKAGEDNTRGTAGWGQQVPGLHYNVIRFADVLLMAAEAKAELGDAAGAMALVNRVRQRAIDMTTVKDVANPTNDAANYSIALYTATDFTAANAVELVRFERKLELAMEGHRYFDLTRWGILPEVMNEFFTNEVRTVSTLVTGTVQDRHEVFPIPLRAIDVAENLTQNPEWSAAQ